MPVYRWRCKISLFSSENVIWSPCQPENPASGSPGKMAAKKLPTLTSFDYATLRNFGLRNLALDSGAVLSSRWPRVRQRLSYRSTLEEKERRKSLSASRPIMYLSSRLARRDLKSEGRPPYSNLVCSSFWLVHASFFLVTAFAGLPLLSLWSQI